MANESSLPPVTAV